MKTNTLDFDAQALREKILDLAMRGKLVPQDPNDEPASVLLEKIKAEKEQLIKDKKIKKSKPLAPITDDERPFDIPDSWEWVRLGDVNTYNSESVHPDRTPDKTFELYSVPIFPTRKPEIDQISKLLRLVMFYYVKLIHELIEYGKFQILLIMKI